MARHLICPTSPHALAEAARQYLRRKFFDVKVAVSGANFAVAETGSLLVVESEGNGRMCLTLPETLISVVGIEKLVPTFRDLEVFLQLLPRSATGERMNPYTSVWAGVTPGDGPQNVHIVLLDNGRTNVLRDEFGPPGAALHPLLSLPQRMPGVRADRWSRVRRHVSRTDRGRPDTAARRRRTCLDAPIRVIAVRGLLRRLPGRDRHPKCPREAPPRRRDVGTPPRAGRALRGCGSRDGWSTPLGLGAETGAVHPGCRASPDPSGDALDARARPAVTAI